MSTKAFFEKVRDNRRSSKEGRKKDLSMPTVAEVFGKALRRIRTQRGITQKDLGAMTGMSHTFIGEMERGLKAPNLNAVIALARALA
jgi:ribosome-binding protein aMBF1 (putative translation factor)